MAQTDERELVDRFEQFYRNYYRDEIGDLAQQYPTERRSLHIDWQDLYRFDPDIADDYLAQPDQLREYAEEALRLYDLPVDVSLGQAHVRIENLSDTTEIRDIRSRDVNTLVAVQGIVRKATDVRPKVEEAAFECQRCGTLTYIPQTEGGFQEPHECQGCERQGPFGINYDQSTFVDAQKLRVQESPEGLRGGETPQSIDVNIEDDITGEVTPGDHVTVTGALRIEQQESGGQKSRLFDVYMDGHSLTIEDEEYEDMDITEADRQAIVELSNAPDLYEQMVDSIAPSIYGYEKIKLAIALQLFSGVTKHLPDESRIRGDMHMLLIGDPGTGKCVGGDTRVTLSDGREIPIRKLVEENLTDPKPVDDGVYDEVEFTVPSLGIDGSMEHQRATKVWKREAPDRMYCIRTASGREVEVTPSHPLFVQADGQYKPVTADNLTTGDFVAVPRTRPVTGKDTIDIGYRESKASNAVRLDLPEEWTPWLARLIGYIIAAGDVEHRDDNGGFVSITNTDQEVLDDAAEALERLGVNHFERGPHKGKQASELICTAGELVRFLDNLELSILDGSAEQRVPEAVMQATSSIKESFLKAYVEGEGRVSTTEREITVTSASRELIANLRSLLLACGIGSQLETRWDDSYRLRISGANFVRYAETIGFITDRKTAATHESEGTAKNTTIDVIPDIGDELRRIRETLELAQSDCNIPRTTYQHYERGDRNPSHHHLRMIVEAFEQRLVWLRETRNRIENGNWEDIETIRQELNIARKTLADGMDVTQSAIDYYEQKNVVPDGGQTAAARQTVRDQIKRSLNVAEDIRALRELTDDDVSWERIESIRTVDPDYDWVYDLEVENTHNYLTNGILSHNSQLLQYIRNIAPRSVYTSGKGSSAAGLTASAVRDDFGDGQQWTLEAGALVLADKGIAAVDELDKMRCVTGDTLVRMGDGHNRPIETVARQAANEGEIETLANGRTIRDVDASVYTMTDDERIVRRPITAVHEYTAPERLYTVSLESGDSITTTSDHPFIIAEEGEQTERPASELTAGDEVYVPTREAGLVTDGGASNDAPGASSIQSKDTPERTNRKEVEQDVERCRVTDVKEVSGKGRQVYDLTVEGTHNFIANGMVVHNSEDRSAMHEALEQQNISISKAGINATLKSRCSLLGAANPKYGRFDQYEPIAEQIDLEPALISRFDLIFTVTDQPDEEEDRALAEHILSTNYAGEVATQRTELSTPNVSEDELEAIGADAEPAIGPELFRKYIAYAKRNCFPTLTDGAKAAIEDFYVDLRLQGTDEDAPVPVTARKLEALIRLAEASARIRLSDTVDEADAERAIDIVRSCLQDIGIDPETGQFDADVIETGTSKSQRDRIKNLLELIQTIEDEYQEGAPIEEVLSRADEIGMEQSKAEHEIEKLKRQGEVYEPSTDHLRTT